ncbi:MAG: type II secretion system F family protein [Vicinamibacterales bacterium]
MIIALIVFVLVAGAVTGVFFAITHLPEARARRQLELRLQEVSRPDDALPDQTLVVRQHEGPLPSSVERLLGRTATGSRLSRLIEQAGINTTPGVVVLASVICGAIAAAATLVFVRLPFAPLVSVPLGASIPLCWLLQRRSSRLKTFEEQFPDALDLVSRAIRAGHAFQSSIGMAADELQAPAGPEFKKVFDQQNFGLPLRDALNALADRVPLVDVKFFVTAVAIQRDTGGNLAEILDNLAHVVRERFKILRQVRVHTAHGRITGFVLLALPAFLAVTLSMLNREHMRPLFEEPMGHTMIVATIVMQFVGFLWIRRVIKIEV